jgi:F420-non-reducing hydrogenase iron-sulfur subunit
MFEPNIIGFTCNWCTYAGADLAGTSRIQYPPNIRMIRVMCTGRINPEFILKAFEAGADGILVGGCHIGDCHYLKGNYQTIKRYILLKRLIKQFGIDSKRLRLEFISASEGERFASVVKEMVEDIRKLGPLNWNKNGEKKDG